MISYFERPHTHHLIVYCSNCSILLLAIVSLLLCIINKLNFVIGMYVCKGRNIVNIRISVLFVVSGIH